MCCLHCHGVMNATGRDLEPFCPGHKSSIEIADLVRHPGYVGPVAVSMVLHVSNRPKREIRQRTGQSFSRINAILAASAEWHQTMVNA